MRTGNRAADVLAFCVPPAPVERAHRTSDHHVAEGHQELWGERREGVRDEENVYLSREMQIQMQMKEIGSLRPRASSSLMPRPRAWVVQSSPKRW